MSTANPLSQMLRRANAWFQGLGSRDQTALKVLGVALVIALCYYAIYAPVREFRNAGVSSAEQAYANLVWMKENEAQARALSRQGGGSAAGLPAGQSLLSVVSASARRQGIELQRFEPKGEDRINIWLDKVEFNRMMLWLEDLRKQSGIEVEQISVDKTDVPGVVTTRLSLSL